MTEIRSLFLSITLFRPGVWLNVALDKINKFTTFISDESEYESGYAYGSEIFDDFFFNVGRKTQILKSVIKVGDHLFPSSSSAFYSDLDLFGRSHGVS